MSSKKRAVKGIDDAVKYFVNATSKQKFKGNEELLWALECIEETSLRTGLSPDHIKTLIDVAASGIQVETVCKRLIKALIPNSVVPEKAAISVISWLCTRKPSINIQCLLLRWLLVIFEYIDTRDNLHAMYGVLFHFLHYRILTPYICHLLYLLTRKEDVKLFRVRFLIQYQKDMGPQAFLTGLLSIYRHYYPSLVHVVNTRSYKSFFPSYDRKWSATVRQVREQNGLPPNVDVSWEKALLERLHPTGQALDLMPSRKRRKVDPIPVIHSLTSKTSYKKDTLAHSLGIRTVPFILIHSFKDVLDNLDSIEFPSQIGAVLRSDTLKHVMSYTKDHIAEARFQFWVAETLQEELVDTLKQKNKERVTTLLQLLKSFSDFLQEGIPAVDIVMSEYLQSWSGQHYTKFILKLVSRFRLYSFSSMNRAVLEPLRKLFFTSSIYFKCKVIMCLTELLRNHAANEWPRSLEVSDTDSSLCLFSYDGEEFSSVDTIKNFIHFVSKMILAACVSETQTALFELCALDFLELASNLHKEYQVPFVVLVEPRLFERLLISHHPLTVSRVCHVICRYKENFNMLKAGHKSGGVEVIHGKEESRMIRVCNQLIVDFCNTLWRYKAFTSTDKNSIFCWNRDDVDKENVDTECSVEESLSLFMHPALLPYTIKYVQKTHLEPKLNFADLKNMKRDYLNHLDRNHFTGLSQFIAAFIRSKSASLTNTQVMGITQTMSQTLQTPSKHERSAFGF
ncbi:centromere protein I-like isoform X2 [Ruditapes philippinarum]|uniref:centromere protein I-like isoform X2 n=1 Tax=Ruditapes philippinarum TaxID=129788 RepID=UPI00295B1BD0|nr:centromere protein I-like isoform X2 [Ruditapes philippinarum]